MDQYSVSDLFDNLSADIEIRFKHQGILAFNETAARIVLLIPGKVHSLVPFPHPLKCVTLFTDFDPNYRGRKVDLINMVLRFKHNNQSFPYEKYYNDDFYVSLHSPNILPDYKRENTFQKLKMGKYNFIAYSESQTRLLPTPYETKCRVYGLNNSREQDMRSDCINKCIARKLTEKFYINCFWFTDKLIRRENLFEFAQAHICDWNKYDMISRNNISNEYVDLETPCDEGCPRNCLESFYAYDVSVPKGNFLLEDHPNYFSISIEHNRFPDQVIEHKPIMEWITLVSDFGGLLGMWLGLSVVFVFNSLIDKFLG